MRELWTEVPPLVAPHYGSIQGDESSSPFVLNKAHRLLKHDIVVWSIETFSYEKHELVELIFESTRGKDEFIYE